MSKGASSMKEETQITLTDAAGHSVSLTADQLSESAKIAQIEPLVANAAEFVIRHGKCSTSEIQRAFGIGYNRAARTVETLEELGVVTAADHVGKREVVLDTLPTELQAVKHAQRAVETHMKETDEDRAVRDNAYRVTADELRQFIERFERLEAEKKDIADQQKEVMAEAKARGYDTKVMRKVIALRKRDRDDLAEEEAVLETYREALGI